MSEVTITEPFSRKILSPQHTWINLPSNSKPEQDKTVALQMSDSDQVITPDDDNVLSSVTVQKPLTLVPENVKKDINIGGVIGTLEEGYDDQTDIAVKFIDYDGEIVEQWTRNSVTRKTALPINPEHEGLIAQGWNWTLEQIQQYLHKYDKSVVVVGQLYKTSSGLTEFDIEITKYNDLRTISCALIGLKDWGDGTSSESTSHTYSNYGKYTIKWSGNEWSSAIFDQVDTTKPRTLVKNIRIGENVLSINGAFGLRHNSLKTITLHKDLQCDGTGIFNEDWSLESVTFSTNLNYVPDTCFGGAARLKHASFPAFATGNMSFVFPNCRNLIEFTIPDGITSITENTFQACHNLHSITIPDSVTTISDNAFKDLPNLKHVYMYDGLKTIGTSAFLDCHGLEEIYIPSTVTSIGASAFKNCYSATKLNLLGNITTLNNSLFNSCRALNEITFAPNKIVYMNSSTFFENFSLISLVFPEGLINIGNRDSYSRTFANLESLKYVKFPSSINYISGRCFEQSAKYNTTFDFTSCTSIPTLQETNAFFNMSGSSKILVPRSLESSWKTATNWSYFSTFIYGV